jgi:hypothetical protein
MRTSEVPTLPVAADEYAVDDQRINRRTIEQILASLHADIRNNRDGIDSTASLAFRRHQFLLMGG